MAAPDIVGKFVILIIQILVSCLVIAGIITFAGKYVCSGGAAAPNMYEHFESGADATLSAIKKRTEQVRALREQIQADLDILNTSSDDICNILKEVEESYVGNAEAPTDPEEFNLPAAIQKLRKDDRKRRAILRFKEDQKLYGKIYKKPILECFYAGDEDIAVAEEELNTEINQIKELLDTAEIRSAMAKVEKTRGLMGFTGQQLKKVLDAMTAKPTEGWADAGRGDLHGAALIVEADRLLGIAMTAHKAILALQKDVEIQKQTSREIKKKQNAVSAGQYSESDKQAGIAAAQRR